jgi:hypothetical protein
MKLRVTVEVVAEDNEPIEEYGKQGVAIALESEDEHVRYRAMNDAFTALNIHATQKMISRAVFYSKKEQENQDVR